MNELVVLPEFAPSLFLKSIHAHGKQTNNNNTSVVVCSVCFCVFHKLYARFAKTWVANTNYCS